MILTDDFHQPGLVFREQRLPLRLDRERFPRRISRIEPLNQFVQVGRVTPCAPGFGQGRNGAHGVTRPTLSFTGREQRSDAAVVW